jgi:tetratricopeptide (TPR) repeat protein
MNVPGLTPVVALSIGLPLVQAEDPQWRAKLSQSEQLYGNRQFSEAIAAAEAALHIAENQVGRESPELTEILGFLGTLYSTKASFDEKQNLNRRAINYLRREAAILRQQNGLSAKQQLSAALSGLGQACQMVHDLSCAVKTYQEAIATAEPLETKPESPDVDALRILAQIHGERKELADAGALMRRYLAIFGARQE